MLLFVLVKKRGAGKKGPEGPPPLFLTDQLAKLYNTIEYLMKFTVYRGVTGGWAGWVIVHSVFGRIEGGGGVACRITTCPPSFR